MIVHPEGSYTELEHLLMRLGLVTEIRPHASMQCDEGSLLGEVPMPGMEEAGDDRPRRLVVVPGAEASLGVSCSLRDFFVLLLLLLLLLLLSDGEPGRGIGGEASFFFGSLA